MINDSEATKSITEDAAIPMDSQNTELISTLNTLVEASEDGQEGFDQAANNVKAVELKAYFQEQSVKRAKFVRDLQTLVQSLGGDAENSGSIGGSLHRGWKNIKSAVVGSDDAGILNDCERGEDSAKSAYQEAMKQPLPDYIRDVVKDQFQSVLASHDHVKNLRDAANRKRSATSSR